MTSRTHMPKYVHATLNANRANAGKTHVVKSVNKDGSISKMALTANDLRLNAFGGADAEAKAEARRLQLEALNPGRRFAVTAL